MSMRKQFVKTVESQLARDNKLVLLLGDIGVFGFQKAFKEFSDRVYNIGILEPSTVSMAAGLAKTDLIPIVHTIAPFLVERSFEQLKIDTEIQQTPLEHLEIPCLLSVCFPRGHLTHLSLKSAVGFTSSIWGVS